MLDHQGDDQGDDIHATKAILDELHNLLDCVQTNPPPGALTIVGLDKVEVSSTLGEVLKELMVEYRRLSTMNPDELWIRCKAATSMAASSKAAIDELHGLLSADLVRDENAVDVGRVGVKNSWLHVPLT